MAKKAKRKRAAAQPEATDFWSSPSGYSGGLEGPAEEQAFEGFTGRIIATMPAIDSTAMSNAVRSLSKRCGLADVCNSGDYPDVMNMAEADVADVIVFQEFGVAVLNAGPDQYDAVHAAARDQGMVLEEERWNFAQGAVSSAADEEEPGRGDDERRRAADALEYLRGYRDGLSRAIDALEPAPAGPASEWVEAADFADSAAATWGLQATGVLGSSSNGAGVKVAVLDTGFDGTHPDFTRSVNSESFIPETMRDRLGRDIELTDRSATADISGHGTHCIGTACGPRHPQAGPRYGIAHGAEIFNGKVLSILPGNTRASGADAWILSGLRWAIRKGCSVISMSLGSPISRGESFLLSYENLAKAAMSNGVLIVAAAGNESDRSRRIVRPVGSPANCPSIVAVGAVSRRTNSQGVFQLANFTNRHLNDQGGEVNFCAPGVSIWSSYPSPRHQFLDGTSQATPHVAGVAALVQDETGLTGMALYRELRKRVKQQGARVDYGNGLVHV